MAQQSQTAEGPIAEQRRAAKGMPRPLRTLLLTALGLVLAGAAYLMAARGEALIVDLAAFSKGLFCF
jgi:hypothetical protein